MSGVILMSDEDFNKYVVEIKKAVISLRPIVNANDVLNALAYALGEGIGDNLKPGCNIVDAVDQFAEIVRQAAVGQYAMACST